MTHVSLHGGEDPIECAVETRIAAVGCRKLLDRSRVWSASVCRNRCARFQPLLKRSSIETRLSQQRERGAYNNILLTQGSGVPRLRLTAQRYGGGARERSGEYGSNCDVGRKMHFLGKGWKE
jgi:hypothetical protein